MLFYALDVKLRKAIEEDIENGRESAFVSLIREKTFGLNDEYVDDGVQFYVQSLSDCEIQLCSVQVDNFRGKFVDYVRKFIKALGWSVRTVCPKEISVCDFIRRLSISDSNGFIDNDVEIFVQLGITNIKSKRTVLNENVVKDDYDEDSAVLAVEFDECCKCLKEELSRIFPYTHEFKPEGFVFDEEFERKGDEYRIHQQKFIGHPVHYIIKADSNSVFETIEQNLIGSLAAAGRLKSRRYAVLEPKDGEDLLFGDDSVDIDLVKEMYSIQDGGTVVVRPKPIMQDGDVAISMKFDIDEVAKLVSENRMDVLSIIEVSKKDEHLVEQLKRFAKNTRFVEICEPMLFDDDARHYLESKVVFTKLKKFMDPAKAPIKNGKGYYISDLDKIVETWRENVMLKDVYSQYSEFADQSIAQTTKVKGNAYEKLESLIGLEKAKDVVKLALDYNKARSIFEQRGISQISPARHMVFTGNPGTAKTTVARLFAQIMKDNGVLSCGNLVEVSRKDLVGQYVGHTAKCVEKAFEAAKGGVLFIDEAYSLVDDRANLYGDEAINTIVQLMENDRAQTVVIFAGYPQPMQNFLDRNPGLRSRIAFKVDFEDYTQTELFQILKLMAKENEFELDDGVRSKVMGIFNQVIGSKDFGNGRFVRNLYEMARMNHARRIVNMKPEELTDEALHTLVADDFSMPESEQFKGEKRRIGFVA